jgi:hypothetical protein
MKSMLPRLMAWIGAFSLIPVVLWLTMVKVPQVSRDLQTAWYKAEQERQQLVVTLKDVNDQFTREQDRYARILKRFPWLVGPSDGTVFLTRLGEVITGLSLKVMGIGVVQREGSLQLEKRGRQVRVAGRFVDNLRLVENVEQYKGFVEELKIQRLQPKSSEEATEEIEAQFRISSVELAPEVRKHLRAFISALPSGAKNSGATELDWAPLQPVPEPADPQQVAALRNPFVLPTAFRKRVPPVEVFAPPPEVKFPNLTLVGIIESTGGRTAIINKRMVKQGEQVEGILVEAIRATEVVLRAPFGTKHLALSAFGETAPRP